MTLGSFARSAAHPAAAALFLVAGILATALGADVTVRHQIWTIGLIGLGAPIVLGTLRGALRGRFAADLVASLALIAAVVLAEPVAGLVIVIMQTGGEALEAGAARRASKAVATLEAMAPRTAHVFLDGTLEDRPVGAVRVGDVLLVRPGEMVPCNGTVRQGAGSFDVSTITGEAAPVDAQPGMTVLSGSIARESPVTIEVTAPADASHYHRIVELVRTAEASKAPIQRLADRAAVWFTPVTLLVCVAAYALSGDPVRVLAVLVVATPCPLILAAPVAMLGGINRSARRQIIVRNGVALERLASVDTAVFDKTGTLTAGKPEVDRITALPPFTASTLLRLAGAVEQGSGHLLARSLSAAAIREHGALPEATDVVDAPGGGVTGRVEGRTITVGAQKLIRTREPEAAAAFLAYDGDPGLQAYVVIDGRAAGLVHYADRIRSEARTAVHALGAAGVRRTVLLSGDRTANATAVAGELGIREAEGDLLPQDKLSRIVALERDGHRVLMVGDGANDAPALAAAHVGLAIATETRGLSAEAADVVLLTDDLRRIPEAVAIARRTMRITRQSIGVGLGLSLVAMGFAAAGQITPTVGALLQEAIDVAVIVNALRVLGGRV
ncbi:MAG: heavy metal translocating P-type ATPase [Gemmatimonadales bacterium]|nr:heavy metal translocating P-type ATPase [Gemmatimonadales bacterium]